MLKRIVALIALSSVAFGFAQESAVPQAPASGKIFNPDISVNILSLYQNHSQGDKTDDGFSLQEVELQFMADIDPYWRASALLSLSKDKGKYGIDPEEVYAETTTLPYVTLRIGKFKTALGKHNQLHTHAYPFIDAPLINTTLLGSEGLNEAGVSTAALVPHVPWYMELTAQAVKGDSETLFNSATRGDAAGVGHLKNLFDLSDALTLEVGASGAFGKNSAGGNTSVFGGDLTFKYRPTAGGKYHSWQWATEYLSANRQHFADAATPAILADLSRVDGLATWILYQFAERWNAGLRYDLVGLAQRGDLDRQQRQSAIVGFNFSEFAGMRLQYDLTEQGKLPKDNHVALQLNITMGAHPAHAY